jgi:two-component system chemotaxis response regulator CheB
MFCNNSDLIVDVSAAPVAAGLVSVGGSAGAFDPLRSLLSIAPLDPAIAFAIAIHTGPASELAEALRWRSRLPVEWALDGEQLRARHVYVARPGEHLIVNPERRFAVSNAGPIRLFRPSVDWLFDSAAASYGRRHIAIVLSGMLSDGSRALRRIKRLGGTVFAQDPATCRYPAMPAAAIATGFVDAVMRVEEMPAALSQVFARRELDGDFAAWQDPFNP